jgi:hypothetical protein
MTAKRSLSAWRWEFLRRRRDYRADWTEVHAEWQEQEVRHFADVPLPAGVSSWPDHFADIAHLPGDQQVQKYGVRHLVNPTCEWSPYRFLGVFMSRAARLREAARRSLPADLRGYEKRFEYAYALQMAQHDAIRRSDILTAHIDLRQPLAPQLQHLKGWAEKVQEELPKLAVSNRMEGKWEMYLRMLDLELQGRGPSAIAAIVYPGEPNTHDTGYPVSKKVSAALRQAHILQETLAVGR